MAKVHVTTTINGEPMEYLCEPNDTMLDALRGPLGLTGSKEGCASGDCGACSITRRRSSDLFLPDARRRSRGPSDQDHRGHGARGQTASVAAEISRTGRAAMRHLHLGHAGRLRRAAAEESRTRARKKSASGSPAISAGAPAMTRSFAQCWRPQLKCGRLTAMNIVTDNKWIGQRTIRPDGVDKVTGRAAFAADTTMPGMIWGKVLRSPHPHARINSIDTSKAEALPGVKAVVTARDIVDFPIDKSRHARHPGHALDVPQRDGARKGAVPRPSRRGGRRHHRGDRGEGLRADRGRLRGTAVVDRDRRCDQAGRADPARVQQVRGQAVQHRRHASSSRRATSREGFKQADIIIERSFTTRPVHQGYIEPHACLVSVARRRQDHDLELEPGPVHGARHDRAC